MSALAFAIAVLQGLPALVAAGINIAEFVQQQLVVIGKMQAEGRDPTAAEWEALRHAVSVDTQALIGESDG